MTPSGVYTIKRPKKKKKNQTSYFESLISEPVTSEASAVYCFQKGADCKRNEKCVIYTNRWLEMRKVFNCGLFYGAVSIGYLQVPGR
jgi:hypothetical protein